ncbi:MULTISPECIES: tRNA lysidine(34) synthetase TilS [unclassified Psychrobacter]|uniref:tRNA lysidine(34) synthetase TilS n=1 Tax=unclassified Psychrobacter TaxID=196806 RepID=UPI000868B00A|nr:tRNA lysidine(34) synthetase TilS [Psychrobacter sp. B29-1]OEH68037.1 MAG: tRNA lysidine(34) synthetase TilS [Psychrobacter sp. B29-1]|tara:strand:- start:2664 stop:4247 length:1584 start_codon:yes stop_codon:yes gene_type:complete
MTSSAIISHPIKSIADLPVDKTLATALVSSMSEYSDQLHGRRLWLACSGGRDSLALAALCVQLYRQGKLPCLPQLLHVDHGLQSDSQYWAKHVANWAQAQQIPCCILQAQVNGHDEQAARQARYNIMRAHINQDDVLLLAHHADDQAETVLMRLIQGAGVNGLSGMQPWRVQTQGAQRNILWRPWLTIRRANISAYAKRLELPYIDDPTNDSGDNVRSGLRRDIMPILATYNPNVIDNIARSVQLLSEAQETINAQAMQDMQQTEHTDLQFLPAQRVLNVDALQKLPMYRQRQLLHYWLGQDEPLPPAKQLVDDVLTLSQRDDQDHQTELFWQGRKASYTIRRYRHQLYRMSSGWLTWLKLPLIEHDVTLPRITLSSNSSNRSVNNLTSLNIRSSDRYIWQLQVKVDALLRLLENSADGIAKQAVLKVAPLERKQRLKTEMAARPQAGKKLYQTLGIPLWLRESLMVVSITLIKKFENGGDIQTDIPLLLASPFESWDLSSESVITDMTHQKLTAYIKSNLSLRAVP